MNRFTAAICRRRFSSGPSLSATHAELKDVELLFQRHQLHKIDDLSKIDELVANKTIPLVMANQLKDEILVRQEAGSIYRNLLLFRIGQLLAQDFPLHWSPRHRLGGDQHLLSGGGAL